jgi:hypothetical protein
MLFPIILHFFHSAKAGIEFHQRNKVREKERRNTRQHAATGREMSQHI